MAARTSVSAVLIFTVLPKGRNLRTVQRLQMPTLPMESSEQCLTTTQKSFHFQEDDRSINTVSKTFKRFQAADVT